MVTINKENITQKDVERFNKHTQATPDGCIIWTGSKDPQGYGFFHFGGKGRSVKAHRFSVVLKGQGIAQGQVICHSCDNPSCVNPDHLFVASQKENVKDSIDKGRFLRNRGTKKLTKEVEAKILSLKDAGFGSRKITAEIGFLSRATVQRVMLGLTWARF